MDTTMTASIIPADQWPQGAAAKVWHRNGHCWDLIQDDNGFWGLWPSETAMPTGHDWHVPVMRPSTEKDRAQANMDAGWYARREAHAHDMGYAGVAEALEDLEKRRSTPSIALEQFRVAVGYMIDCAETDAELSHARRLLALIDGQANDNGVRVDRGALQMAINVLRRAGKDEVADALKGGVIEQPTKGEGE